MKNAPVCLIVDDEPDTCWALEHVLQAGGIACRRALRARQALEDARATPCPVALLDAKLPDMDGLELARRLRGIVPGVRILVVSGYFYPDDAVIQEAKASGVIQGFIAKPFRHEEIMRAVRMELAARADSSDSGTSAMEPIPHLSLKSGEE